MVKRNDNKKEQKYVFYFFKKLYMIFINKDIIIKKYDITSIKKSGFFYQVNSGEKLEFNK